MLASSVQYVKPWSINAQAFEAQDSPLATGAMTIEICCDAVRDSGTQQL